MRQSHSLTRRLSGCFSRSGRAFICQRALSMGRRALARQILYANARRSSLCVLEKWHTLHRVACCGHPEPARVTAGGRMCRDSFSSV